MKAFEIIHGIKLEIIAKQQQIHDIRKNCQHVWKPSRPAHPDASSPLCAECAEERSGWWCEASPDKECDYSCENGRG